MIAYHYDDLRFFDGEISCQIDPLESESAGRDVYLLPADCTPNEPEKQDGYTPRWNGNAWEQYADDKIVYGYTENNDGTINYYGAAHTAEELSEKNPGVELSFSDVEPVSVDGRYWLSADNPDYIAAKKAHDKREALDKLDAQYDADKAEILKYYSEAQFAGDDELVNELRAEMAEIDAQYIENRKAIEGSEE